MKTNFRGMIYLLMNKSVLINSAHGPRYEFIFTLIILSHFSIFPISYARRYSVHMPILKSTTAQEEHFYFNSTMQEQPLIHFSADKAHRILAHYYGIMHFTNPKLDNFFKRFVRDYMHYHDKIYCAAGKIVIALQEEGQVLGFELDGEQGGGYSSMHVRRGDLQYKKVKISAEEWYQNLNDTWQSNEIIYIATDERNKTFFDPIAQRHSVKFLDDYWDMAGLADLDPNYMGMIDTIVASRGRVFGGTFFSTFSGYINRMRGRYWTGTVYRAIIRITLSAMVMVISTVF